VERVAKNTNHKTQIIMLKNCVCVCFIINEKKKERKMKIREKNKVILPVFCNPESMVSLPVPVCL